MTKKYDESSIRILKGLEPVKLRPGMYTRTNNPLHIVQEVLDNAIDEVLAGFANKIVVELDGDKVTISDNGRGIPVGLHPEEKVPVVQAVFTILHAGGKFDKGGDSGYSFSGGLHGVGVSVTNALSDSLEVTVCRDGNQYEIGFSNGEVVKPLKKVGKSTETGTKVSVLPNPKYFDSPTIPVEELRTLLKNKAVLSKGLSILYVNNGVEEEFVYEEGLTSFIKEALKEATLVGSIIEEEAYFEDPESGYSKGEGAAWAFCWTEEAPSNCPSFVNMIPTPGGGTHVSGLKSALFNSLKNYCEHHGLMHKGLKLNAEDVFKNLQYVLSCKILDPSFEGQTKDKLNMRDALKLIEKSVQPKFEAWLNHNPVEAKQIAEICLKNASLRAKSANKIERKKSSSMVLLPGKLSDCESSDYSQNELFLVEGDSAGGSAKQARNKEIQAVLPMRGKSLNVWEKTKQQALENDEIRDIATAIGIEPHGLDDKLDFSKLRYHKICILADADVDGFHIQVLQLTLFLKHFPQLIENGYIYISKPPLYRLDTEAQGKKKPMKKIYVMDEKELKIAEQKLYKEGYTHVKTSRFKGLGEMNPTELWSTTLDPETRTLLSTKTFLKENKEIQEIFDNLMNKNKADWRKSWIEKKGYLIKD